MSIMHRLIKPAVAVIAAVFSPGFSGLPVVYAQPLGIGASRAAQQPQVGALSAPNGRFVFGQISGSSKDQFMLDTATGRLWRMGESGKVGIFLKGVPYLDAEGECTLLPDQSMEAGPQKSKKK